MTDSPAPQPQPPHDANSPPLKGETVSFTGTLASMTHAQAQQIAEQRGGVATEHVSRKTTMLVVGEEGWPLEADGQPSQKLLKVTEWQLEGVPARIVKESDWLHLLGLDERKGEVHRLYTPAMLSQVLDVPVHVIRGWERSGLIKPVRKVYRLPYFDFQEVTSARRLTTLIDEGVPLDEIRAGLTKLHGVMGGVERPLAQLQVLASDRRMLIRDRSTLLQLASGQRFFDFEPPEDDPDVGIVAGPSLDDSDGEANRSRATWTSEDWFRDGCELLASGEAKPAVESFRMSLMERPDDAECNFHLAESLYRLGNVSGAIERYYAAVELDHDFLEAWTQLGCLFAEQDQLETALESFCVALNVHPEYPDAHWHAADVLERLGRVDDAIEHWRTYVLFDSRGPWAEQARERLENVAEQESAARES